MRIDLLGDKGEERDEVIAPPSPDEEDEGQSTTVKVTICSSGIRSRSKMA